MIAPIITTNLSQIQSICKQHHVKELYVFGSAAKNEMKEDSDIDFLVEFKEDIYDNYASNYFDLLQQLNSLTKKNIDLVTVAMLKNVFLKSNIEKNKQTIYVS